MLFLLVLLAQSPVSPGGPIFTNPATLKRQLAFFEFAPAEGWGLTPACACATVTGAKGEAVTITRASSASCITGSMVDVEDGAFVTCADNLPRIMPGGDGSGGNGIAAEGGRTNTCIRSKEQCNAAWADVGTPSCSADQAAGPRGAATMDQFTDNAAGAFEGRSQVISTTSATRHTWSCYVKAGTATSASVVLAGTGSATGDCTGTVTGLSTTKSKRVYCVSPAAFGGTLTAVTVTIRVGTVAADQGTLFVDACQHEVSATHPSTFIATDGTSASRPAEVITATLPLAMSASTGSHAVTFVPFWSTSETGTPYLLVYDGSGRALYDNGGDSIGVFDGANDIQNSTTFTAGTPKRVWSSYEGATITVNDGADTTTGTFDGTFGSAALTSLGLCNGFGTRADGVCKRICADLDPLRCRQ